MKYIGSAWKESNILQPLNFMFELSPTVEPTALAQARATLPPLRKALAQQRDLLAALAGTFRTRGRCSADRKARGSMVLKEYTLVQKDQAEEVRAALCRCCSTKCHA